MALFNPRQQVWHEHFAWSKEGTAILGLTACGRATTIALQLNNEIAMTVRGHWQQAGALLNQGMNQAGIGTSQNLR